MADNEGDSRRAVKRLRRGKNADDSMAMGYEDAGGVSRTVQGDREGPWLKTPPFPTPVERWFEVADLQSAAAFVFTDPLNVSKRRLLSVWFDYDSDADDLPLLVVPQARIDVDNETFRTISVVDPLLTRVTLGPPFSTNEVFGQRDFMASVLRIPDVAGGPPTAVASLQVVVWDVAAYNEFRLGLSNGVDDGAVRIDYSFSD